MLIEDLFNFNFKILEKSNLTLRYNQDKSKENIVECDGKKSIYEEAYLNLSDKLFSQPTNIVENPLLGVICVFGVFDSFLDIKYNNLAGLTFKKRHDLLPINTNEEIIQKSFYRIYKIIRNAITHNISSITCQNGNNIINYRLNNTTFFLEISDNHLVELYTATIILLDENMRNKRGNLFKEGILLWYYNSIISSITISDDCVFDAITGNPIPLDPKRIVIINAQYKLLDSSIMIENDKYLRQSIRDFSILIDDECYVIPQEYLNSNKIAASEINVWKADMSYLST